MFGKLLAHSPLLAFPLAGLAIFLTVFTAVVIGVMRRRGPDLAKVSALPLLDDEVGRG